MKVYSPVITGFYLNREEFKSTAATGYMLAVKCIEMIIGAIEKLI
jgi:hypothetical protein